MKITLWSEGFDEGENKSEAHLLGQYDVPSFDYAVNQYLTENPDIRAYYFHHPSGDHLIYGSKLFDNEQQARLRFG